VTDEEGLRLIESRLDMMEKFTAKEQAVKVEMLLYAWNENFEYTSAPVASGEYLRYLIELARKGLEQSN